MPEILRIGKLKFIVRVERNVRHHRPHIHVIKAEYEATFSIDTTIECLGNSKFNSGDLKKIETIVTKYQGLFLEEWRRINEEE